MKTKHKIISLAFFGIFVLLIGCQAEEDMTQYETHQQRIDIGFKQISFSKIMANGAALQTIESAKRQRKGNVSHRGGISNDKYGVFIDTARIYLIEKDNTHWITFQIVSEDESEEKVENLVLQSKDDGTYKAYITEYNLTPQELLLPEAQLAYKKPIGITSIGENGEVGMRLPLAIMDCISTHSYSIDYCTNGNGQEVIRTGGVNDGCVGGFYTKTFSVLFVSVDCILGGGGSSGISGPGHGYGYMPPGNPSNPGSGVGVGTNPGVTPGTPTTSKPPTLFDENGNPILTTPILGNLVKTFVRNYLNDEQTDWWNDPANVDEVNKIKKYLDSLQEEAFAVEMINAMMEGREVNVDELYIETPTPDDDYEYDGPKEYIPSTLILENGDEVTVTFGVTTSDNKSANNKVATELIDALKSALNDANNNLPSSEKITSINIMATTNGDHGPNSNHYSATAVDINRINGGRIIKLGANNQVVKLQEGFDKFQYIRENLGPHFKHKYSIENNSWNLNVNVGGHQDHIHASVRKP